MDYKKLITSEEYRFLRENEHLGNNIILLGLGGSHAYGTNVPTSDIDIRGIAIERPQDLIGLSTFEQVINSQTDTTIYSFNKMCQLLAECNPNIVEILGLREKDYLYMTPLGKELLDHKDLFLSQRCYYTFSGYARAQLKKLENALARDNYPEDRKNSHIATSLISAIEDFNGKHNTDINPCFAHVNNEGQLLFDINLKDFPAEEFEHLYATVSNTMRNYRELNHRNRKKDDAHLNKHAMHLVRLNLMCIDLLEKGEIKTYRDEDHDLLMSIRNGDYMNDDGNMKPEFYELVANLEERCKKALENTKLPKKLDYKKLEAFIVDVNTKIINGEYNYNFNINEVENNKNKNSV